MFQYRLGLPGKLHQWQKHLQLGSRILLEDVRGSQGKLPQNRNVERCGHHQQFETQLTSVQIQPT